MHRLAILTASRLATRAVARQHVALPSKALPSFSLSVCLRRAFVTSAPRLQAEVLDDDKSKSITSDYTSLKPFVHGDTYSALVGAPFNFTKMSEVQERVLSLLPALADPLLKEPMRDGQGGRDLLVKAKTGTGKTIAFLTPAIERRIRALEEAKHGRYTETWIEMLKLKKPELNLDGLDESARMRIRRQYSLNTVGALIISPTRELAMQIADEAKKLSTWHKHRINVHLFVGGASRNQQMREFNRSTPDIIVATPGRLMDFLREESVVREPMKALQTLIYDEADTLLDMGFRNDIEEILRFLPQPEQRTTMMFSATVSKEIREIAREALLPDHRFIDCVPAGEENVHEHVPQSYTVVEDGKEQLALLTRLIALDQLRNAGKSKVIVFLATKHATKLFADMYDFGLPLNLALPAGRLTRKYELHSNMDANKRSKVSGMFRSDNTGASVLFTSDVSARGVDYPGTSQVIQVGIPATTDTYIHRVGRTGRAGKQGRADLVILPFEENFVRHELRHLKVSKTSTQEVQAQVEKLAEKYEENPKEFVGEDVWEMMERRQTERLEKFARSRGPHSERAQRDASEHKRTPFAKGVQSRLAELEGSVDAAVEHCNEEEAEQSFMSFLGYYAGRVAALRLPLRSVVDNLKSWAVSIANLERPPFVSDEFLKKIGGAKEFKSRGGGGRSFQSGRFQDNDRRGGAGRRSSSMDRYDDRRGGAGRRSSSMDRYDDRRDGSRFSSSDDRFF